MLQLLAAGHPHLVAASRHPDRLQDLAAAGCQLRHADFDAPETLDDAFAGVRRALIISTDKLLIPGKCQQQHEAALAAAVRNGVQHVAYTSMPNPARGTAIPFAADHAAMELGLQRSGLSWTSLRNSWYQKNLLAYLPQIVRDGAWYTTARQGRITYVARADAAAAAVLAADRGQDPIDVAGPQTLTVDQIAAIVSTTLGRHIRVEHVGAESMRLELARRAWSRG